VVDRSIDYMKVEMAFEMGRMSRVGEFVVGVDDYSSATTKTSKPYVRVRLGLMWPILEPSYVVV